MATVSYIPSAKLISLLSAADPQRKLNVRVINTTRLSLDNDAFQPVSLIDLSEETVLSADNAPIAFDPPATRLSRKSGEYQATILAETIQGNSLKEVLGLALQSLEKQRPGSLEKLAKLKTSAKRIVAHSPTDLFIGSPHLAEKYAERLTNGWWFGTNNSGQETNAWLRRACESTGLKWDRDIKTSF